MAAGEPVHHMLARLELDDDYVFLAIHCAMKSHPFPECAGALPELGKLVGVKVSSGWRKAVNTHLADARGCTHIRELLVNMGTAAYQTVAGEARKRITHTIVDATIIGTPSSTKNANKARDPEMHQTRKGQQWCVSRTQAADLWCCTEDGSRPPEAGLQEQASNHPMLLRSKGAVVSDWAKVIPSGVVGEY